MAPNLHLLYMTCELSFGFRWRETNVICDASFLFLHTRQITDISDGHDEKLLSKIHEFWSSWPGGFAARPGTLGQRIWQCCSCGVGHSRGVDSVPDPGNLHVLWMQTFNRFFLLFKEIDHKRNPMLYIPELKLWWSLLWLEVTKRSSKISRTYE